jgi:REP element-mobilizing transposase RayT
VGRILRDLCEQKGIGLLEGHAASDHIHLFLSIPPKYSVAYTVGFLKGKSAVRIHRELLRERRMTGLHFWATGYFSSAFITIQSSSPRTNFVSFAGSVFRWTEMRLV